MKKIAMYMMAMVFTFGFGLAYAGERMSSNMTDYTGGLNDTREADPSIAADGFDCAGVDGIRAESNESPNSVTNYSGWTEDTFEIGPSTARHGGWCKGQTVNQAAHESDEAIRTYDTLLAAW
jgi:hypothetical protein